jgi:uncharacterized lipoprotein NlpE involved in copper resistance
MNHRWNVITAALVLVLLLGGCNGAQQDSWPVGTCVQVEEAGGTTTVACTETHTHKVIAIAQRAEDCPSETDMISQPADADDGLTTTCFQSDTATK